MVGSNTLMKKAVSDVIVQEFERTCSEEAHMMGIAIPSTLVARVKDCPKRERYSPRMLRRPECMFAERHRVSNNVRVDQSTDEAIAPEVVIQFWQANIPYKITHDYKCHACPSSYQP